MTSSGVKRLYKQFINSWPKTGSTPIWSLPSISRLGEVRDIKFGINVSNRKLLNSAKFQGSRFYRFWAIKGKPAGVDKITCHPPLPATQIRVNAMVWYDISLALKSPTGSKVSVCIFQFCFCLIVLSCISVIFYLIFSSSVEIIKVDRYSGKKTQICLNIFWLTCVWRRSFFD